MGAALAVYLDFHVREQRQVPQDLVQSVGAGHVEDAQVGVLADKPPEIRWSFAVTAVKHGPLMLQVTAAMRSSLAGRCTLALWLVVARTRSFGRPQT